MAIEQKRCGICGAKAWHLASHVLHAHLPYIHTQADVMAALNTERVMRLRKGI